MFVSRLPQHRPRYGASETYTYHTRFDRADGFARGDGGEALGNVGAVILTAGAAAAGADMDLGGRIRHATCEHKGKNSASTSPAQIQAYHGHIQASQISIAYGNRQPVLVLTVGPGGVEAAVRRPARIPGVGTCAADDVGAGGPVLHEIHHEVAKKVKGALYTVQRTVAYVESQWCGTHLEAGEVGGLFEG